MANIQNVNNGDEGLVARNKINSNANNLNTIPSGQILVGNVSNISTAVPMSGDVHIDNAGITTIQPGVVTGNKIGASVALAGNPTTTTQTQGDDSTRIATTAYVDTGLAVKAPLASPAFTGAPTAPTPFITDNSDALATTAFVVSYLNNIEPVKVGSSGEQFANLNTAYAAGYRSFYITSNVTQTNFLFAESIKIKIKGNVSLSFTPNSSQVFRIDQINTTATVVIEAEELGANVRSTSSVGGSAFFSANTNSFMNLFFAGNLTFDFSPATLRIDLMNTNSRCINFYQGNGAMRIKTPNNLACGILTNATTFSGYFYAEYLIFEGAGTTSGFLSLSTNEDCFIDKITIEGSYISTFNLLNIAVNSKGQINCILLKPTVATACIMQLCGLVQSIINPLDCQINITIASNNAILNNANLGNGTLNINNRTGFQGNGIYNYTTTNISPDTRINANPKISTTPTPTSIISRETQLYLGGTNGEVYQFIGNAAGQPVLINVPPFRFSLTKVFAPSVTVNNGVSYNLFTTVTAGDIAGGATTNMDYVASKFAFQNANLALLFPPFLNYTDYKIRVQLQGTIGGAAGTDRQFSIDLRRGADNSLILEDYVTKLNDNDLTGLTRLYISFVNGLADPFITGGLRIVINNNSGTSITLTGFSLLIQGVSTNFIQ